MAAIMLPLFRLFAVLCLLRSAMGQLPTATIDSGLVIGTTTSLVGATASVNKFLQIPFAASPPTRFAPPERPAVFSAPINATVIGPACIQQFTDETTETLFSHPSPEESEDCLYLNVFAPSTPAPDQGRAVLFYIFGGAFMFGNAGQPMYDGSALASFEDVVVVTANYRTNVFGFPNSPHIPLAERNLGLLDQREALDWTQRNIHAFGGNPSSVTTFGQSAGGMSVDASLTSYPANSSPPFHAAILDSGVISYDLSSFRQDSSGWDHLSAALACPGNHLDDLACVRAASASRIRSIIDEERLRFLPQHDNVTFVSDPAGRRASGDIAKIPILTGSNAQDGLTFVGPADNITTFLDSTFPNYSNTRRVAIASAYPIGRPGIETSHDQIVSIYTDAFFACPASLLVKATVVNDTPAWRYLFNASFPNNQPLLQSQGVDLHAWHSSELYLIFGYPYFADQEDTEVEKELSRAMMSAWAGFAKNPTAGPGWTGVGTGSSSDLAVLGQDGKIEVVDPTTMDSTCHLYEYDQTQ